MKIAVLGGYAPGQSVGAVFRAFQRAGHEVWHWPTFPEFNEELIENAGLPDLLFTFKIGLGNVPQGLIKSLKIPHKVFWSFDDPHWINHAILRKEAYWYDEHDIVLTSCAESTVTYGMRGFRGKAHFLPPAMDVHVYDPTPDLWEDEQALCSFICTNLYPRKDFPENCIERKDMVDRLHNTFGKDFALYGFNPGIADHPACRGIVHWENSLPLAIRTTRMNINNHAYNRLLYYFNERFFQIVSTRRAMFLDRCAGYNSLFGEVDDCFIWYSTLDELVEKLLFYKDKPEELSLIGHYGYARMRGWTYDEFVKQVMIAAAGGDPVPAFMRSN